jgi:hypothetical protein
MNWNHREPTLDEILPDHIVIAVMEADGVDPQELAATLRQAGRELIRRTGFLSHQLPVDQNPTLGPALSSDSYPEMGGVCFAARLRRVIAE